MNVRENVHENVENNRRTQKNCEEIHNLGKKNIKFRLNFKNCEKFEIHFVEIMSTCLQFYHLLTLSSHSPSTK